MAGTSETLLEARIISTAFGCLSSRSAGGDRSGTNRSSRPRLGVFVMGSKAAVGKEDSGQPETWRRGVGGRDWDRSHCLEQGVLLLHQREGSGHHKRFRNPGAHL